MIRWRDRMVSLWFSSINSLGVHCFHSSRITALAFGGFPIIQHQQQKSKSLSLLPLTFLQLASQENSSLETQQLDKKQGLMDSLADVSTDQESPNHLETVGNCMIEISSELENNSSPTDSSPSADQKQMCAQIPHYFQLAGEALLVANTYWKVDWTETTIAFADAASAFQKIAENTSSSSSSSSVSSHSILYQTIGDELHDASTISGCVSIGPMSCLPNLEIVQQCLQDLADLPPPLLSEKCDEDCLSTLWLKASKSLSNLIEEKEME